MREKSLDLKIPHIILLTDRQNKFKQKVGSQAKDYSGLQY